MGNWQKAVGNKSEDLRILPTANCELPTNLLLERKYEIA